MRTQAGNGGHRGGRSRRAVLRAGGGVAAAALAALTLPGCGLLDDDPGPEPPPDPLEPLLAGTAELIRRYDAALAAHPELVDRLAPVRETHAAHAAELARLLGVPVPTTAAATGGSSADPGAGATPGSSSPADARGALAALRAAEQTAQRQAAQVCLTAPAGRAALLGSVSAARASHAEALR